MSSKTPLLILLLSVLALVGCNGMSFNPKGTMCIDPAFSPEQSEGIIAAAEEWHDKTSGDVDFKIQVGSGCNVDVIAVPYLKDDGDMVLGLTDFYSEWIKINVKGVTAKGNDISQFSIRETMLHEIGHYLTGSQHSPTRGDIMFAKGGLHRNKEGELAEDRHLSAADVNRWTGKTNHSYYDTGDDHPAELPDEIEID
jgi:hypothetical protein